MRSVLVGAPHVKLDHLRRLDNRLAAHVDGLAVAGEHAWPHCDAALAEPSGSVVFTVAARAVADKRLRRLDDAISLAQTLPSVERGLLSAFGWLEPAQLQGVVSELLKSPDAFRRFLGISACSMHSVDPGIAAARYFQDESPLVRSRALRLAGELGLTELVSACVASMKDDHPDCQLWAAVSAVLLGNRGSALEIVMNAGMAEGPRRARAFRLALQAISVDAVHGVLKEIAKDPEQLRWLIHGSGLAGDSTYVPWLIKHMSNDQTARLAGEAFSLITGTDLALLDLERKPPENFESGPNDDPDDPNVDMDPDDGLPWPDAERIQKWWAANSSRFQPGTRYFMGAPVTRAHCIDVLKNGYQRQRILAAHYLCLLDPGTPLFNTSAPAWRQQRLLAQMV